MARARRRSACGGLCRGGYLALPSAVHLDLRALLESMERYAKELQALHGGLDSINEHVSGMIRDFAAHVDTASRKNLPLMPSA